jgi:hypothetical protein
MVIAQAPVGIARMKVLPARLVPVPDFRDPLEAIRISAP